MGGINSSVSLMSLSEETFVVVFFFFERSAFVCVEDGKIAH